MFAVKVGAYPREAPLRCSTIALPANIRLSWKGLPWTNVLAYYEVITYGHKKFYNIGPWTNKLGVYYKNFIAAFNFEHY
jgi:hypothetical protein